MAFLDELNSILESAEMYQQEGALESYEEFADAEEPNEYEFLQESCVASAQEIYKIQGALLKADVLLDQNILEGTMDEEQAVSVMEATLKSYFDKAVGAIVSMKNKAMEFINNLINFIKGSMTNATKFVQNNKDKLQGKSGTYNMHEFTMTKGDSAVSKAIEEAKGYMKYVDIITNYEEDDKEKPNTGEIIQSIQDAYMSKEKKEINFSCNDFIAIVAGRRSGLDGCNRLKSDISKAYDTAISNIKSSASKSGEGDGEGKKQANVNKLINNCRASLSLCNKIIAKKKEVLTLQHHECLAALRSVISGDKAAAKEKKAAFKDDFRAKEKIAKRNEKFAKKAAKAEEKEKKAARKRGEDPDTKAIAIREAQEVFGEEFEEVLEAFTDIEFEITMEGFKPERHQKRIEKVTAKVEKKLAKLKSEKQKEKLLKFLNSELESMEQIREEHPEEKGRGVRAVKSLIVKVKRAKVAVEESLYDMDEDFEDVLEACAEFEYELTMEGFNPEKHQKRLEKLTAKFEKKIANLKSERQKERLIKRLENELDFMKEIHEDSPEEKGKGARVIKSLLVKAKRAKVPTKESVEESFSTDGFDFGGFMALLDEE